MKTTPTAVIFTRAESRKLALLLDVTSAHVEASLDAMIIPGTGSFMNGSTMPNDRELAAQERKDWRLIENWKIKLEGALSKRSRGYEQKRAAR